MIILIQILFRVFITFTLGMIILICSALCSFIFWRSEYISHARETIRLIIFEDE